MWQWFHLREQAAELDDEVNRQLDSLFRRSVEYQPSQVLDETEPRKGICKIWKPLPNERPLPD
jgi:hypothetical protein